MKYSKIKKKVKNIVWLKNKQMEIATSIKENENFYTFKCSVYFSGYALAELNRIKYDSRSNYLDRKYAQMKRLIKEADCKEGKTE